VTSLEAMGIKKQIIGDVTFDFSQFVAERKEETVPMNIILP